MFKKILILIFVLTVKTALAQSVAADTTADDEQKQLSQCYTYSSIFGYTVDTIANHRLYETISDWLGTRYCYGGDSKKGIDCSDFVIELYKNVFNIELEGNARDLFNKMQPLKKTELQEGDMVFFKIRRKRISHVGVYLGNNKFVHASVKLGVVISDLDEPYYKKRFYRGGRRTD